MKSHAPRLPLALSCLVTLAALACGQSAQSGSSPGADAAPPGDDAGDAGAAVAAPVTFDQDPLSVEPTSRDEHEPNLAVSPTGHVIVSWLSYLRTPGITVGYRISNDFGDTWGPVTLLPMPAGANTQANASVAADASGNVYLSWGAEMHAAQGRSNQRVLVATAAPGEVVLGAPVEVTDPAEPVYVYDQPRITVTGTGAVNVSYNKGSADGSQWFIMDANSADGGKTWTREVVAGPGAADSFRNFTRLCHPASGRLYMTYLEEAADNHIALTTSDDQGKTWSPPATVSEPADAAKLGLGTGCVARGDEVWVYYEQLTAQPSTSNADDPTITSIRIAHSGDRGATFDWRQDALDTKAVSRAMTPVLMVEDDGTLDLAYYGGAADGDAAAAFRRARATDGRTFEPSTVVHQALKLETSRAAPQWIGDWVGGGSAAGKVLFAYTDNSTTSPHIAFHRVTMK